MAADLEQLGPIGFQDLAGALCIASFGPGIQVMGSGRDGGRDLYYQGRLVWKGNDGQLNEEWDGYTVFQVKHKQSLEVRPEDNARWLQGQIRSELKKWSESASGRDQVPDYLLFITNVPLTPTPGTGGHDQTIADVKSYISGLNDDRYDVGSGDDRQARYRRLLRIRQFRIWDANQIQALLNVHAGVRLAFPGFFTAADVFGHMSELTGYLPRDQIESGLRAHARTTLTGESSVYFDEAGSGDGTGMPLHDVVIDLPITLPDDAAPNGVIRYVLDRGERMLKPTLTTFKGPRHLIIAGAPGNGKTTISKFLVQAYRAASLANGDNLSTYHRQIIAGTECALGRFQWELPRHSRWAMRIDLAQYAEDHGFSDDFTVIGYIAEKVSKRSDVGSIRKSSVLWWLKRWPSFLILDGLDEVTEPKVRKWVIERVVEFVTNAEAEDCDVFVVMTTRPMGYVENIAPTQFERVDLDYLSTDDAIRYGEMATRARLRTDLDRVDRIVRQLELAAHDDSFQLLLRTPLQVLIMTIILGNAGHLAPDRYRLFWGYYDTVFRREREKATRIRSILQNYGLHIQRLHEQVGFELQKRSEAADRSYAALTRQELRDITWRILDDAGFNPSGVDSELLDKILTTATHRLVLIVPRGDEGYGFDVRSLQELMAARYLTTGTDDAILARLRISAASPHWRNTVIFAVGHWFSEPQDHRHQAIVELVETVDHDAARRLGSIVPVGPRLALDLIDDGMASAWPRWRHRLIRCALQVLHEPCPHDLTAIARVLIRIADIGDEQQRVVEDGLRDAQAISLAARDTTQALQDLVPKVVMETGARARINGLAIVRPRPGTAPLAPSLDGWDDFEAEIETALVADSVLALIRTAASVVRSFKEGATQGIDVLPVIAVLADADGATVFETALQHVVPQQPAFVTELRDNVLPAVYRAAIGDQLRHSRSNGADGRS
ncbi:hypothetical protein BAY61_18030 [Prauserella marina]|uniref:Uncharacterized protein n=1 Tax=Prauserella marina TaxID=530584 RepID=A0A222VS73_9PSEU|nr:hypothetical protein [Prauserella marina]ASR36583.1 hypothetical protein BAY61_18030 [Prauserella marina]PWV73991.1 hypothetical protein DES30_108165 [Prauserella marina]SDD60465.1 hypothetical protein SAMN05421630_110166 [Prauserella marina]